MTSLRDLTQCSKFETVSFTGIIIGLFLQYILSYYFFGLVHSEFALLIPGTDFTIHCNS